MRKNKILSLPLLLLITAFFFIRLSPIAVPWILNGLITTHNCARLLIIVLFGYAFLNRRFSFSNRYIKIESFLVLIFLISQTLTILSAVNIIEFLGIYKNLFISILFYFCVTAFMTKKQWKIFVSMLVLTIFINAVYELFLYFYPDFFNRLSAFFPDSYYQYSAYELGRGRFFYEFVDESFIPLLLQQISTPFIISGLFNMLLTSVLVFLSALSNWRYKLVLIGIGFISLFLFHNKKKLLLVLVGLVVIILLVGDRLSFDRNGTSVLGRIQFNDELDRQSVQSRFHFWSYAIDIFRFNPVIGAGLGNYYDVLPSSTQLDLLNQKANFSSSFPVITDPHNIFFTLIYSSGLIGIVAYILMIGWFLYQDVKLINAHPSNVKALIVSFWIFFLYGLFNPVTHFHYQAQFWFLRGMLAIARS